MITLRRSITNIESNETVVLYPTFGHLVDGGKTWRVRVIGTVYEPGTIGLRKRILIRLLQRFMQVEPEALESSIFQQRIRGFIAATEKGKRVAVRVGSNVHLLQKKSKRNGHFTGTLRLSVGEVERLQASGALAQGWLNFDVITPRDDVRKFVGRAQLLPFAGVSVISDIDDTIKHTKVTCRRSLLANTFLREFRSIEGMAARYREWADQGAAFHYVSSSPWQLYGPLAEHCERAAFPSGTFHLRSFQLRDHMLRRLLLIRRPGKGSVIKMLVETFPQRRFVLVGDSGERDAEIYGHIARRYPRQISTIYIRQLAEKPLDPQRCAKAFRNIPRDHWRLFEHADQLPGEL